MANRLSLHQFLPPLIPPFQGGKQEYLVPSPLQGGATALGGSADLFAQRLRQEKQVALGLGRGKTYAA
ncbi:hypothetical protein VF14_35505 [Nostoc linckia z18]|jgi:hypothetical protein|uniref:Uncharacterized protein n=2 Tax=Nostoc linckia TaxID=92942 RepID=A0A9Q6EIM4_NOSLI|nr:hypothetical protein VF02_34680 [Nostoc linckia z1]PHJ56338.1 hypothetical protein VF05_37375 [Nostoc linckia z3]PHJ71912.1 hypothetical protein VF03_19180 [Nostoc linckia z2]PHJ77625.1 hypothetical protein VF06_30110 [Nostoc linckia z4]PHJ85891.1 hypothetical protein VF07_22770 [Nostoc linckia z6]PHJ87313.1 hypothetical protein VF04_34785 [Nostoc linckia z7]PHJ96049.1 hypothetical protein VF08_30860 [Nostoc linckia z8]PHK11392.1 hypothetical protein VF11_35595 [Nostoc linckia z14]PHK122